MTVRRWNKIHYSKLHNVILQCTDVN